MAKISVLDPKARAITGASASNIVVKEADLTAQILCNEGWSPSLYKGGRRSLSNFLSAQVIGIDVDEGTSLKEALTACTGRAVLIGTTKSHQVAKGGRAACDRFRVVCILAEPVTSFADYTATLLAIGEELGLQVDQAAKDAARWYIPCVAIAYDGLSHGRTFAVRKQAAAAGPPTVRAVQPLKARNKLSRATTDFIALWKHTPDMFGSWHAAFYKAAVDMKEQMYTQDEAATMLASASPMGELDATDLQQLEDVYANRGGALEPRIAWPALLPNNKGTAYKPVPDSPENCMYLLKNHLGYEFRFNKRSDLLYISNKQIGMEDKVATDTDLAGLRSRARSFGLQANAVGDAILEDASKCAFDPIVDAFKNLEWDGHNHIEELFKTITLKDGTTEEQQKWYYQFLYRWLIAAANKLLRPGSENNVLVLQGEQAAGKSRWLKKLSSLWPDAFVEGHVKPDDKDHNFKLIDNVIWHVAEFEVTTTKKEVGALKDFFTKDTINERRPYSKMPMVGRSICSFCASVNSYDFLQDLSGNRRYLVIPVVKMDAEHKVNIEQVWAQARAASLAGERYWYNMEEIAQINDLNKDYMSREEWLEALEFRTTAGTDLLSISEIVQAMNLKDEVMLTKMVRSNIRMILEKKRIKGTHRNNTLKFYVDKQRLKGNLIILKTEPPKVETKGVSDV